MALGGLKWFCPRPSSPAPAEGGKPKERSFLPRRVVCRQEPTRRRALPSSILKPPRFLAAAQPAPCRSRRSRPIPQIRVGVPPAPSGRRFVVNTPRSRGTRGRRDTCPASWRQKTSGQTRTKGAARWKVRAPRCRFLGLSLRINRTAPKRESLFSPLIVFTLPYLLNSRHERAATRT